MSKVYDTPRAALDGLLFDGMTVMSGGFGLSGTSVVYVRNGQVIALDCVNATKEYVQGRALVMGRVRPIV